MMSSKIQNAQSFYLDSNSYFTIKTGVIKIERKQTLTAMTLGQHAS